MPMFTRSGTVIQKTRDVCAWCHVIVGWIAHLSGTREVNVCVLPHRPRNHIIVWPRNGASIITCLNCLFLLVIVCAGTWCLLHTDHIWYPFSCYWHDSNHLNIGKNIKVWKRELCWGNVHIRPHIPTDPNSCCWFICNARCTLRNRILFRLDMNNISRWQGRTVWWVAQQQASIGQLLNFPTFT